MRRFVSTDLYGLIQDNQTLLLPKDGIRHLVKVLRLKDGEEIEVCDGRGNSAIGVLSGKVIVLGERQTHPEPPALCVVLSIIKTERFRFAIEKLAELGVREIRPLFAERGQVKIPIEKREAKLAKWLKTTENATRQSGRFFTPLIYLPEDATTISKLEYDHIVCHQHAKQEVVDVENPAIWIGPEGGFSENETAMFDGFEEMFLSRAILRSETAAILAASRFSR